MSAFERSMAAMFASAIVAQIVLGLYRSRMLHASPRPALALALIFAAVGALWLAKRLQTSAAFLARPAGVVLIAMGIMSMPSAIALPIARGCVPLFAFSSAALLIVANQSPRAHAVPAVLFVIAVATLEIVLLGEIR